MTEREKEVLHKNVNRLMYGAKVLEHEIGLPARDQEQGETYPTLKLEEHRGLYRLVGILGPTPQVNPLTKQLRTVDPLSGTARTDRE
jgi:hypothetical protein